MASEIEPGQPKRTIVLFANTSWYLWNFRRRLATAIQERGFDVLFVAPEDSYSDRLREISRFVPVELDRKGKNPFLELRSIVAIAGLLRREWPQFVLTWTPKPNIYSGLVSRISKVRVVPNVSGLGAVFVRHGLLTRLVSFLYATAFRDLPRVFFQNSDDRDALVVANCVSEGAAKILPGSGVDLERFSATRQPDNDLFTFLYGGRLIKEKGLPELVEACRRLRADGRKFNLQVFGHFDPGNPSAISESEMAAWVDEGLVNYHGPTDHMEVAIQQCDCVVHPSHYREGVPRILIEAAASGRPTITTDNVGCRDAVEPDVTGLMCERRDADGLAAAMQRMIEMPLAAREEMAHAGRRLAESRFDEHIVIREYLAVIGQ